MADVTISNLGPISPSSGLILPVSNGSSTGSVTIGGVNSLAPVQSVFGRTGNVSLQTSDLLAGCIISVYQAVLTSGQEMTSGDWTALPNLSISLIPKTLTSKFLIRSCIHGVTQNLGYARFVRNGTPVGIGDQVGSRVACTFGNFPNLSDGNGIGFYSAEFLDSPVLSNLNTITYAVQVRKEASNFANLMINRTISDSDGNAGIRPISTLTIMEIRG